MGATLQQTRYSNESKKILTEESTDAALRAADVKTISGIDILSNSQVGIVLPLIVISRSWL